MNSVILQIASKHIKWLLLVFAIIALMRGHNYPGGGFIGGLLAALGIVFNGFAYNSKVALEKLRIQPEIYISVGLLLSVLSLVPSLLMKTTLMKGVWVEIPLPFFDVVKFGTPFLFDIGVFLTVIGVTLMFFFSLTKNE